MFASLSRQAGQALVVRQSAALQVAEFAAVTAHGSISSCGGIPLAAQTSSALSCCSSSLPRGASYGTVSAEWEDSMVACSSDAGRAYPSASSSTVVDGVAGCTSPAAANRSWRRAFWSNQASDVVGWTRAGYDAEAGTSFAGVLAPFTSLALKLGLGGASGGLLAARRLRGEPEPFEDEQDDDEYEDGEYVDFDDEEILADLDELDEMEIDGEWDEGEWEEDRQAEEELGEGEEQPSGAGAGLGAGAEQGRKAGVAPPPPPSPRPARDWRS